ncbi:MAG: LodA/GoxA family CTQ-dependent oxidase [Myxococcota bacterium]
MSNTNEKTTFRIHPSIGFARVGTSDDFYLAPETLAGHPIPNSSPRTGGLPIKAGTEDEPIESSDVRGRDSGLTRQGARFRIYAYTGKEGEKEEYPRGGTPQEIRIGDKVEVDGRSKTVRNIVWTVHMANKKTAWYGSADDDGILAWGTPHTPTTPVEGLRNPQMSNDCEDRRRWKTMFIDPGPRTIEGKRKVVHIDESTVATYYNDKGDVTEGLPEYPKTFPKKSVAKMPKVFGENLKLDGKLYPPGVEPIDSLGELRTDEFGRLIVVAARGRANSFNSEGAQHGFVHGVNNDWWFDDTGDGPVNAVLVFNDGTSHTVEGSAWVISTDPSYAPQILNMVSLWDDIYDTWVRKLALRPTLFGEGEFNEDYRPAFEDEVRPIFLAPEIQRWVTNMTTKGIFAHENIAKITAKTDVSGTAIHGLGLIRKPVEPSDPPVETDSDRKRMPLALGDAGRSLLSLTKTQYHYLKCWNKKKAHGKRLTLNAGEHLDKASLVACLGGRFGPGIDMGYICREPDIWSKDWRTSGTGPFRINAKPLDYETCRADAPFLTLGWTPKRDQTELEPGDVSKFMAIPWHADYNSCGNHLPKPNIEQNNQLYWSWPAQRPLTVYAAKGVGARGDLGRQRFSIRGPGTKTRPTDPDNPPPYGPGDPAKVGRYQETPEGAESTDPGIARILDHWMDIGVVIQATNINDGHTYDPSHYLEVESKLDEVNDEVNDEVQPWDQDRVPPEDT